MLQQVVALRAYWPCASVSHPLVATSSPCLLMTHHTAASAARSAGPCTKHLCASQLLPPSLLRTPRNPCPPQGAIQPNSRSLPHPAATPPILHSATSNLTHPSPPQKPPPAPNLVQAQPPCGAFTAAGAAAPALAPRPPRPPAGGPPRSAPWGRPRAPAAAGSPPRGCHAPRCAGECRRPHLVVGGERGKVRRAGASCACLRVVCPIGGSVPQTGPASTRTQFARLYSLPALAGMTPDV